jgi:hypothetical protein
MKPTYMINSVLFIKHPTESVQVHQNFATTLATVQPTLKIYATSLTENDAIITKPNLVYFKLQKLEEHACTLWVIQTKNPNEFE